MTPYKVIQGKELGSFEQAVSEALEQGYTLAGELIVHTNGFYQPMILDLSEEDDWEEEEEEDFEWEEDIEE